MANPDHLAILQDALEKDDISIWNDWVNREGHIAPDLQEANLQSANLHQADLRHVNFYKANLHKANLNDARLNKAEMRQADLTEATLFGADLSDADLFRVDLSNASLHNAKLFYTKLDRANLQEANLRSTHLQEATFREANLKGAKLHKAQLRDVNLYKANLSSVQFSEAYIYQSNFEEAKLNQAEFGGAHLIGGSFKNANLERVNFGQTNLIGGSFKNANLERVNFGQTNLIGVRLDDANFEECIFNRTTLANIDISTIKNLDKTDVRGPCTIGIDTLYKSQAVLGEPWFLDFLEKCGVPETMRIFAKSLVVKPIDYYSCFISYSSADEDFAKLLYDTLRGQNIRVWYAPEQILPGHDIKSEIIRGIQYWDKVILCCSKSSMTEKWWVDFEQKLAEVKEQELQRKYEQPIPVIVRLQLDDYIETDEFKNHPNYDPSIWQGHIADFTDWKNHDSFKQQVDRLIKALQTDDGRELPPESKL